MSCGFVLRHGLVIRHSQWQVLLAGGRPNRKLVGSGAGRTGVSPDWRMKEHAGRDVPRSREKKETGPAPGLLLPRCMGWRYGCFFNR